jgi:hypothetical protein
MDTNTIVQWLELRTVCDTILWSPGLPGYRDIPIDQVVRELAVDVVLLPDWHSLLGEDVVEGLWRGSSRCEVPVAWYINDPAANVELRKRILCGTRPAGVFFQGNLRQADTYEALRREIRWSWLVAPPGVDRQLFFPARPGEERDIDILISGASDPPEVYPVRRRVQHAARLLADRYRVLRVPHPGYWELQGGASGRGQAHYAQLLRRSRLATTGTAYGKLAVKYNEAAACGAIGVGDLPQDEPAYGRLENAMLVIDEGWSAERIAAEMAALLENRHGCEQLVEAACRATDGLGHPEHAADYADLLKQLVERGAGPIVSKPPRPAEPARAALVVASPDPDAVPPPRRDWHTIWNRDGRSSRTRRLHQLLAETHEDVAVISLDPDSASPVDALLLAEAARQAERVMIRPARLRRQDENPLSAPWASVAVPRAAYVDLLARERGRDGPERALLRLADAVGVEVLAPGGYADAAGRTCQLSALWHLGVESVHVLERAAQEALAVASHEGRVTLCAELAGWAAIVRGDHGVPTELAGDCTRAEDPELEHPIPDESRFAALDLSDRSCIDSIAAHAAMGASAPPLALGVPLRTGCTPAVAGAVLANELALRDVDIDSSADLVVLERPLWESELNYLAWSTAGPVHSASATIEPTRSPSFGSRL